MSDMTDDTDLERPAEMTADEPSDEVAKKDRELIARIQSEITADKAHHSKAFKRMRDNMWLARYGYPKDNSLEYTANIIGRHIKQKTATLYAKNPKIVASRRQTMDFAIWDETPEALQIAQQTVQLVQQAVAQAQAMPAQIDPVTGMAVPAQPMLPPGAEQAQALIEDVMQGYQRRTMAKKYARTFELLMAHQMREQKPTEFKDGIKKVVRRTLTCSVGYVELGYQTQTGPRPGMAEQLADARARLDHLRELSKDMAEEEFTETSAEMAELEYSIRSLQAEPEIVLRQGLIFDYPMSTRVIPDRLCVDLRGFVGARRVTIEYVYTVEQVNELFGVDIGDEYKPYKLGKGTASTSNTIPDDADLDRDAPAAKARDNLVLVWKVYDKVSGLVYYLADGHCKWLRPPAAPEVYVEDFWPVYALVFNDVEDDPVAEDGQLYPPSDIELLQPMQEEYNRARSGKREHRRAARPRWAFANSAFSSEEDAKGLSQLEAFEMIGLNIDQTTKINDILQSIPVPGVDPNLYDVGEIMTDMQIVSGAQEAQYGATTDATATQSAIAANSTGTTDGSAVDELDGFLSRIARAGGQILQRQMPEEEVKKIVGPGAYWPPLTLDQIAQETILEIEAGSSGRPNKALDVQNWQLMAPTLLQIPGITPTWLAKETIKRLDDRIDLSEAITEGMPSIMALNAMANAPGLTQTGADGTDPAAQGGAGGQGAANAPQPDQAGGSAPPMGDNKTTPLQVANDPTMS